ncbi:MAG: adenine methyltransferase, partial [Spirochaetales bacterium]
MNGGKGFSVSGVRDAPGPFLTRQLIAYIGNKRRLLPFLRETIGSLPGAGEGRAFLDPFAGSGSVSRLAKVMGFAAHANDWEFYSWVINTCYLAIDLRESEMLFPDKGGMTGAFALLRDAPPAEDPYISRFYAPAVTASADYRRERLFYTAENALFIDSVREQIENWYPGWDLDPRGLKEKCVLTASLLYEAATHANTSGVFKACHKGFGGHGGDALGRILSPMELEQPFLVNGAAPCSASLKEAEEFVKGRPARICYLDPPYNCHQYGSNYFMLNTIARWDKPAVNMERGKDGRFREKAAIRKDWTDTRSAYCYNSAAADAFAGLLNVVDAEHILVSYNTEGIIPFEQMADMLAAGGELGVRSSDYVKYRGGRQSLTRKVHNMELLFLLRRGKGYGKGTGEKEEGGAREILQLEIRRIKLEHEILSLSREAFHPGRVRELFAVKGPSIQLTGGNCPGFEASMRHFHRFETFPVREELACFSVEELLALDKNLKACRCEDRKEEADLLLRLLETAGGD